MPGSGRRLGDGAESDKEDSGAETPAFAASMGSCLTGIEAGEHALAADLVAAVQGGTGTVTSVHKALRR